MTIFRQDEFTILNSQGKRISVIEQGCPPFIIPPSDQFQNSWDHALLTNPDLNLDYWGFRICDGGLEFQGHLTGGATDTVCYTLPVAYLIFPKNPTDLTDIVDPFTGDFTSARVVVDMISGDITITWPSS